MGAWWCWCKSKKKKEPLETNETKKNMPNAEQNMQPVEERPHTPAPTTFEILHSVTEKKMASPKKK